MNGKPLYQWLVASVQVMLGIVYVINGLNWWVKLISIYPSISDFGPGHPPPPDMVGAMISTGFLFHIVKATELVAGICLLANRFVPLALVMVFPVTVNVFLVDVFMIHHLRGFVMGFGSLLLNGFLMIAYFSHYAPMLSVRGTIEKGNSPKLALAILAAGFGLAMLCWVAVLILG